MLNYYPYFWQSHSRKVIKKTTEVRALNGTFCSRVYFDCQKKLRVVTSFEVYPFIFNLAY